MNNFYLLKKTNDTNILKAISKNLLNSLYGRFSLKISDKNAVHVSAAISSYARIEIFQYKILIKVYYLILKEKLVMYFLYINKNLTIGILLHLAIFFFIWLYLQ